AVAAEVFVAYAQATNVTLEVGGQDDARLLTGFYEPETAGDTGRAYRWSKPLGFVELPGVGSNGRFSLEMDTFGGPAPWLGSRVEVTVNDVPVGSFSTAAGWTTQRFEFATSLWGDGDVMLRSQQAQLDADSRSVGVAVGTVRVRAVSNAGAPLSELLLALL